MACTLEDVQGHLRPPRVSVAWACCCRSARICGAVRVRGQAVHRCEAQRLAWSKPQNDAVLSFRTRWVRSVAFEPGNEWFCTGSGDRTIKIWDTASGQLRLTLTGHIEQVGRGGETCPQRVAPGIPACCLGPRGKGRRKVPDECRRMARAGQRSGARSLPETGCRCRCRHSQVTGVLVSERHPYMFSCALDKQVKCWDLEQNKVGLCLDARPVAGTAPPHPRQLSAPCTARGTAAGIHRRRSFPGAGYPELSRPLVRGVQHCSTPDAGHPDDRGPRFGCVACGECCDCALCLSGMRAPYARWSYSRCRAICGRRLETMARQGPPTPAPPSRSHAVCRVWDIRTKVQVHCLSGHEDTVASILAMPTDPQVRAGAARLWPALPALQAWRRSADAMCAAPSEQTPHPLPSPR